MSMNRTLGHAAFVLGLAALVPAGPGRADTADEKHYYVRVGDRAPAFELPDDEGKRWRLADHLRKRPVVLFFYMGDFMPNSAREVCAFRNDLARLRQLGVEVVGVSGDTPASHEQFKKAYRLNFTLLSDYKGEVGKRFGLPMSGGGSMQVKGPDGEEITVGRGCTPAHWTWVIGRDGKVLDKFTRVQPAQESKRVLALLEKWKAGR